MIPGISPRCVAVRALLMGRPMTHTTPTHALARALAVAGALAIALGAGCVVGDPDPDDPDSWEEDPAGEMAGEELSDEGPPPGEDSDEEPPDPATIYAAAPRFQLPFPCDQIWAGQTRTGHSPRNAVDFNRANDEGDPVVAAAAGTVSRVENTGSTSYGRWIEINHGNGYTTRYAHLSRQTVSRGQTVRQGQKIGEVGNTGGSTGAHLHYEQRYNGVAIRASFDGAGALYFATKNYRSKNACGGGGGANGRVNTAGAPLTVRSGPGTGYAAVGSIADGTHVTIYCQRLGQSITGTYGTTRLWDKVGTGYISDAFVYTGSDGRVAPDCP